MKKTSFASIKPLPIYGHCSYLRSRFELMAIIAIFFIGTLMVEAGCYCRMMSRSVSASYNKTGFESCDSSPKQIYLQKKIITLVNGGKSGGGGSTSMSNFSIDTYAYDFSAPYLLEHAQGCHAWSLSETDHHFETNSGSYSDSGAGFQFTYTLSDSDCGGSWSFYDSSGGTGGSMCSGIFPYNDAFTHFFDDYWWLWETTIYNCTQSSSEIESIIDYTDGTASVSGLNHSILTLSQLYTDQMLRSQIIAHFGPWPTEFSQGPSVAFYDLNDDHDCGSGGKMQYFCQVPDSQKGLRYKLQWQEVTSHPGSTNTVANMYDTIDGTGDPVIPAPGHLFSKDMPGTPSYIYETAPDIIEVTSINDDGGQAPGNGGPKHN